MRRLMMMMVMEAPFPFALLFFLLGDCWGGGKGKELGCFLGVLVPVSPWGCWLCLPLVLQVPLKEAATAEHEWGVTC